MASMKDVVVKKPTAAETATAKKWPVWEHPAATFEWFYTQKEKCLILQGKVTVRSAGGKDSVSFGVGDWVEFPKDLECVWEIKEAVRKHYEFE
jgi:uncharacterized cupin superfamily protein